VIVLSHRGYWREPAEKNTEAAFRRSFERGFGTETDLRDLAGELVISHDPPRGGEPTFRRLLELHRELGPGLTLALNVKSDGLQAWVSELLEEFGVEDAFVFDMAVPDALGYLNRGLSSFTRVSEEEPAPAFHDRASGVWIDGFRGDWADEAALRSHLDAGKRVCVVSPELHGRDHRPYWSRLAAMTVRRHPALMICTDLPEEAERWLG
jgi:glycerophosphoryl diester phosphodiesterase